MSKTRAIEFTKAEELAKADLDNFFIGMERVYGNKYYTVRSVEADDKGNRSSKPVLPMMYDNEEQANIAIKCLVRYNSCMNMVCYEHNTIGTWYSESTEGWNIRDMISEARYAYDTHFERGHANCEELKSEDYNAWRSEVGRLDRFIEAYKPYMEDWMTCCHVSVYDLPKDRVLGYNYELVEDLKDDGVINFEMNSPEWSTEQKVKEMESIDLVLKGAMA